MARIRSIHPGLATDEAFMSMSVCAKAVWPLLWTECDDHGIFEWKPIVLKARLLPADAVDFNAILEELTSLGAVRAFELGGKKLGAVKNFCRYQRPKKPLYRHAVPEQIADYVAAARPKDYTSSPPEGNQGGSGGEEAEQRKEEGGKGNTSLPETGVNFPNTAPSQASGAAGDVSIRGQDEAETFAAVGIEDDSHYIGDATEMVPPEEPEPDEIPAALDRRRYPEAFEELWLAYRPIASPNATKADACTAWKRLSAADKAACLVGLRAYVAWLQAERRKRADAPAKHLSTFINRRGWETAGEGTAEPAGGGVETTWVLVECSDWARCEAHYRAEHGGRPPPRTSGLGGMGWRFPTTWLEQEAA